MSIKIIHFSDLHIPAKIDGISSFFDKRVLGILNYHFRRKNEFSLEKIPEIISFILNEKPDIIICTGDLTSTGQPSEFKDGLGYLAPIIDSDIPLLFTPGNHDAYVKRKKCIDALKDSFDILNSKANIKYQDKVSSFQIKDYNFIIVNEAKPTNPFLSCGYLDEISNELLKKELEKKLKHIIVGHFPIIEDENIKTFRRRLNGKQEIKKLLETGKFDLSLCGHIHRPYTKSKDGILREICCGSITKDKSISIIEYDEINGSFNNKTIQF